MAKETKVGVLTGLAFIICFAVVLANRGTNLTGPTVNHYASRLGGDAATSQPGYANAVPEVVPVHHVPANAVADRGVNTGRVAPAIGTDRAVAAPPTGDQALGLNQIQTALNQGRLVQQPNGNAARIGVEPTQPVQEATLTAQFPPTSSVLNQPPQLPNRTNSASHVTQLGNAGSQTEMMKHIVAPGETLWSVASRVYGRTSAALVNGIYEANRSIMSSPDSVKAGMELAVPKIAGVEKQANPTQTASAAPTTTPKKTAAKSEKSDNDSEKGKITKLTRDTRVADASTSKNSESKSSSGDTRWYQVRKNDRLMGIAREQLGDAGRWEEIYDMNKDKFADPAKIREGVRIKLPATKAGKSRSGA